MNEVGPEWRSDASLIEGSLSSPALFSQLFERHAGAVHRYLSKRVGAIDAEDLVGETCATAYRTRGTFRPERSDARPWLFGIATNLVHHYWRAEARRLRRDTRASRASVDTDDPGDEATTRVLFESQLNPIASGLFQSVTIKA